MAAKDCKCCGKEVDVNNGGCALMMAFCIGHTTTLTNIAFCKECYEVLVEKDLKSLNASASLGLIFGEGEE